MDRRVGSDANPLLLASRTSYRNLSSEIFAPAQAVSAIQESCARREPLEQFIIPTFPATPTPWPPFLYTYHLAPLDPLVQPTQVVLSFGEAHMQTHTHIFCVLLHLLVSNPTNLYTLLLLTIFLIFLYYQPFFFFPRWYSFNDLLALPRNFPSFHNYPLMYFCTSSTTVRMLSSKIPADVLFLHLSHHPELAHLLTLRMLPSIMRSYWTRPWSVPFLQHQERSHGALPSSLCPSFAPPPPSLTAITSPKSPHTPSPPCQTDLSHGASYRDHPCAY